MNSPGFTAEASLYRSRQSYRAAGGRGHTLGRGTVRMAQGPISALIRPSPQIAHQAAAFVDRSERSFPEVIPPIQNIQSPNCAQILWSALTNPQVIQSPPSPPVVVGNKCSPD